MGPRVPEAEGSATGAKPRAGRVTRRTSHREDPDMTALTYAGIGARATPSSVLRRHDRDGPLAGPDTRAGNRMAFALRRRQGGRHCVCRRYAGRPADALPALARLQRPPGSGLRGALRGRAPCLHGHRRPICTRRGTVAPGLSASLHAQQRRDPARREMRSAGRCGGLLDARAACSNRRHRYEPSASPRPTASRCSISARCRRVTVCERLDAIRRAASGS